MLSDFVVVGYSLGFAANVVVLEHSNVVYYFVALLILQESLVVLDLAGLLLQELVHLLHLVGARPNLRPCDLGINLERIRLTL